MLINNHKVIAGSLNPKGSNLLLPFPTGKLLANYFGVYLLLKGKETWDISLKASFLGGVT
jgi:hypothetical protein